MTNLPSPEDSKALSDAVLAEAFARERAYETERPAIQAAGEAALQRLYKVAIQHSGQCRIIARFLLGCYNGRRFPFDLTDFRAIDEELFQDCLAVLRMDARPEREVHLHFKFGGKKFEKLARDWEIRDHARGLQELQAYRARFGPIAMPD